MSFEANSEAGAPPKLSAEVDDNERIEAIELEDGSVTEPFIQRGEAKVTNSTKKDAAQLKADQTTTNSLPIGNEKPDLRPAKASTTVNGHDRLVGEPLIQGEQEMLENKDVARLKDDQTTTNSLLSGSEKPDVRPVKALTGSELEYEDYSKLPEWGIHSLTHSVSDAVSRPISEVEDDSNGDQTEIPLTPEKKRGRDPVEEGISRSELGEDGLHDFEKSDGEIDSASGGQSHEPHSEEPKGCILSPNGNQKRDEGSEEDEEEEHSEVIQACQEVQDEQMQSTEAKVEPPSERHPSEQSNSEDFSANRNNLDVKRTEFVDTELEDTASNLGILSSEPREEHEESTQQQRLHSETRLLYPQPLEEEDGTNPFSSEVRRRKVREQPDVTLGWEAKTVTENTARISQSQLNLEEIIRLTLPDLEDIHPDQPTGSSGSAFENGLPCHVEEIVRTEVKTEDDVENVTELSKNKTGVGEAVLLGALASGVNRPTWFVVRAVLVGLVASLLLLLQVAIKSGSWFILLNVLFLIGIAGGLILLLSWYIKEIGLVSVEKQMAELNLTSEPSKVESKTL